MEFDFKRRRRQRGVEVVQRNQRVEGAQHDFAGEGFIAEGQPGERKLAVELHFAEVRQAGQQAFVCAEAVSGEAVAGLAEGGGSGVRRGHVAVQHAHVDQLAAAFGLDRQMAVAVVAAFVRAVHDLPVDQLPGAGKPDAAGADAAQRK